MRISAFIGMFIAATGAMGQTPGQDQETMKALLTEVRQLRQDIEAMTVASQRVQIALYSLQIQDAAVTRAAQRLDEVRDKRVKLEDAHTHLAQEVQRLEASMTSGTLKGEDQRQVEMRVAQLKTELDAQQTEMTSMQATEGEASSSLRTEQAKLSEVQDRIDRLDRVLANATPPPAK